MVVCLEQGANLHMAQLMSLPLTVSCFSKIQIGFTFLVPAYPSSPGKRAFKRVCVCVCVLSVASACAGADVQKTIGFTSSEQKKRNYPISFTDTVRTVGISLTTSQQSSHQILIHN